MILRLGDTQEVPDDGVFEWDGCEHWVSEDSKLTHGEMYAILRDMGLEFSVKSARKESD